MSNAASSTVFKKGHKVWIIRDTDVESGTVTSVSDEGWRVKWGSEAWSGIDGVRLGSIFKTEKEACVALAIRLQQKADSLWNRAGVERPVANAVLTPKPLAADLHLNSHAKFWAVLEALQQYIDNGNDAEHLIDDAQIDEFKAKLEAAEAFRDQLDGVLASLANT